MIISHTNVPAITGQKKLIATSRSVYYLTVYTKFFFDDFTKRVLLIFPDYNLSFRIYKKMNDLLR